MYAMAFQGGNVMKLKNALLLGTLLLLPGIVAAQSAAPPPPPPNVSVTVGGAFDPAAEMQGQSGIRISREGTTRVTIGMGTWWKNSETVKELGLTEQQVKQIEDTFYEHRLKLIDLRADLERQETRLQPLIEADQPDEAKVSAQIDQVLAARGRLEKAHTMWMLSIRRVLSVEQWKKLQSIQQQRGQREIFFERMMPGEGGAVIQMERRPPGESSRRRVRTAPPPGVPL